MPSTNASNLAQTLVGLAGQAAGTPTSGNTLEALTLGDGDDVNHFVLLEDGVDGNLLFKVLLGEGNLVGDGTTVDLDFHDVSLLLAELELSDLGVGNDTDNGAVLADAVQLASNSVGLVLGDLLGVLGEGLLLGAVPVLVEASQNFFAQVSSPNGGQGAETLGGFDVTNNTDDDHRGSFNNGDGFNDFLLVQSGARLLDLTDNVSHTSLVADESSQVGLLASIVLGELSDSSTMSL